MSNHSQRKLFVLFHNTILASYPYPEKTVAGFAAPQLDEKPSALALALRPGRSHEEWHP
jgi:hypothetical protein